MIKLVILLSTLLAVHNVQARFVGGIGYIQPGEYRVDNEINPLPLGISVVPMIFYRGERLSVLGPNLSYSLIKGPINFALSVGATGDRYKTESLEQRDAAINAGFSLRLLFLTLNYASDVSNVFDGNTMSAGIGWRFQLTQSLFFTPSIKKEFLNSSYVNYYYGVSTDEAGRFTSYRVNSAVNDIYAIGLTYILNPIQSFSLNYSYKVFDQVIFDSPTINEKSYGRLSFFWNYKF